MFGTLTPGAMLTALREHANRKGGDGGKTDPATGVALDDVALVFDLSGNLLHRYLHGPGIDQVFADEDAVGNILWSLTDHQGTIRDWADYDATTDTTTVTNHLEYDTFGNITTQTKTVFAIWCRSHAAHFQQQGIKEFLNLLPNRDFDDQRTQVQFPSLCETRLRHANSEASQWR